jgi:hypothetical protein
MALVTSENLKKRADGSGTVAIVLRHQKRPFVIRGSDRPRHQSRNEPYALLAAFSLLGKRVFPHIAPRGPNLFSGTSKCFNGYSSRRGWSPNKSAVVDYHGSYAEQSESG